MLISEDAYYRKVTVGSTKKRTSFRPKAYILNNRNVHSYILIRIALFRLCVGDYEPFRAGDFAQVYYRSTYGHWSSKRPMAHRDIPTLNSYFYPTNSGSPKHTWAVFITLLLGGRWARGGRDREDKRKRARLEQNKSVASSENYTLFSCRII